jgi:hypothetical protein
MELRALLEMPLVVEPLDSFPAFYGTRRLITAFPRALQFFLLWARQIQSTLTHRISPRSIFILSTHLRLRLPSGPFPSGFPTITYTRFFFTYLRYKPRPSEPPQLDRSNYTCEEYKSRSSSLCSFLNAPVTSSLFGPNILLSTLFSNTPSHCSFFNIRDKVSHP